MSCGNNLPQGPPIGPGADEIGYRFASSNLPRNTSPNVPASELNELVSGNTQFGLDIYRKLSEEDGNLFYSPYSISIALGMTFAGAKGNTEAEMADTLHFTLPQNRLHPAFNYLDLELMSRGQGAKGKDDKGFRLNIANSLWGETTYTFLTDFLDTLALNYGAGLNLVDFINQPEKCREYINWWVENRTEQRIKNLLPQGILTSDTRLVLVNAIYFNAAWLHQFEDFNTSDEKFFLLDGGDVMVPMMNQTEDFGYSKGDGWQACQMLYDGGEMAMVILLPDEGMFGEIEQQLDADYLDEVVKGLEVKSVELSLPKFEFDASFGLKPTLESLGMKDAFIPDIADLSGMDGTRLLYIMDVIHKAL